MAANPLLCSACQKEIALEESGRAPGLCPHCGALVIVDDVEEAASVPEPETPQAEQELEERRIRQIVRSRRAVVRTRGWYIVGTVACLVLAGQQVVGWTRGPWITRVALLAMLLGGAAVLWEKVRRLTREMRQSALIEPATPPDFTPLSNGSQHAKNLEDIEP